MIIVLAHAYLEHPSSSINQQMSLVRLSLVRSSERMSDNAHALGAFHYSCFESRPIPCDHEKVFCGTDVILHETSFTVPCVPDGEYVLGWSWYGAYAKGRGQSSLYNFGDYWSCSFIRIEGGSPVRPLCRFPVPKFVSGTDQSQCEALSNRVGMCNIEPCPYLKQIQGSALLCPDPMVKIGTECIPYFPRKTLVHVPGPQLQISEYRYCSTFRSHGATASNRLEFLAGFLDKKGHLVSVQRVCDKSVVPDLQLHYGMTILALVTGAHKALIFRVDGTSVNYEHIQPYSIAGNMGNIFNSFIPPRYNSLVNITAIIQDENGKYSRPHHFQVKFETVSNNTH